MEELGILLHLLSLSEFILYLRFLACCLFVCFFVCVSQDSVKALQCGRGLCGRGYSGIVGVAMCRTCSHSATCVDVECMQAMHVTNYRKDQISSVIVVVHLEPYFTVIITTVTTIQSSGRSLTGCCFGYSR